MRNSTVLSTSAILSLFLPACCILTARAEPQASNSVAPSNRFLVGSSYYPEQWDPSRWEDDFRKMHDIGFNVVRMGEFAWAFFEPAAGHFEFAWMDRAIEVAKRHGISVILCTPTASVPPWLRQAHPDVLGANERGAFDYGGRKGYSTESPAMLEAADRIVTALVKHFGSNPGVIGWQIDNEPGYPFMNYDRHMLVAYRKWLQLRYGSIARLNTAWGGAFWSNWYDRWDQIEFPLNVAEGGWQPGMKLDYRRFFADSFFRYVQRQARILRGAVKRQFLFTNWPDTRWSVDVVRTAAVLDVTAWDNYVAEPGRTDFHEQFYSGFGHDQSRGSRPDQRFMVAEQGSQASAGGSLEKARLQTYINLGHGADGTIFFEWRPPLGGAEQGYVSVLQLDGTFGPSEKVLRRLTSELARVGPELASAKTDSDIAMLFSYDNQWWQGFWTRTPAGYDQEIQRYYSGLKALHRNIDVVPPTADLNRYRLVAAPGLQIVSDELTARLKAYVNQGGILVLNARAGLRDPDNRFRELAAPGVFAGIAGVRIPATANPGRGVAAEVIAFDDVSTGFAPATILEGIEPAGAVPLASYRGGAMNGRPAVTVNASGRGFVVYVGTDSRDLKFYDALALALAKRFGFEPLIEAPIDVEVVSRKTAQREYLAKDI